MALTLFDLIYAFDRDRDSLKIQICKKDDWDEYDTLYSDSPILEGLENKEVKSAAAIEEDVIRVDLRWN